MIVGNTAPTLPPPPRSLGQAGRVRALPYLLAFLFTTGCSGCGVSLGINALSEIRGDREIFEKGRPDTAKVKSKRVEPDLRTYTRSGLSLPPGYFISLALDSAPNFIREFEVRENDYSTLPWESRTPIRVAESGRFVPEISRDLMLSTGWAWFWLGLGLVLLLLPGLGWRVLREELKLLRFGVELVGEYENRRVHVEHKGKRITLRLWSKSLAQTVGRRGIVVLALPDLSRATVIRKVDQFDRVK